MSMGERPIHITEISKRLLLLKGQRPLKEFAEMLGLPQSTVHYYLNGREPSLSFILKVAQKFRVREEWILTGKEPIFKDDTTDERSLIESMVDFLKQNWETWPEKKRHWFELQFKRLFPEFEEWHNQRIITLSELKPGK